MPGRRCGLCGYRAKCPEKAFIHILQNHGKEAVEFVFPEPGKATVQMELDELDLNSDGGIEAEIVMYDDPDQNHRGER